LFCVLPGSRREAPGIRVFQRFFYSTASALDESYLVVAQASSSIGLNILSTTNRDKISSFAGDVFKPAKVLTVGIQ